MKGAVLCQGPSQSPAQFVSVQQSSAQVNPLSSSAWGQAFLVQGSLEPAELREQPQPSGSSFPVSRAELVGHAGSTD